MLSPRNDLGYFIIQLGGFDTRMSFLAWIGYLMRNSGMGDTLELIYAENTVPNLLSAKAVDRAIKGHKMADTALHTV